MKSQILVLYYLRIIDHTILGSIVFLPCQFTFCQSFSTNNSLRGVMATRLTSNQKIMGSTPIVSFIFLIRDSLMVRMGACRVPDRGSIPRRGDFFQTNVVVILSDDFLVAYMVYIYIYTEQLRSKTSKLFQQEGQI